MKAKAQNAKGSRKANKQASKHDFLSIIVLNLSEFNFPIKR